VNFRCTAHTSGVTYIRWGRRECEDNGSTLLYRGMMRLYTTQWAACPMSIRLYVAYR